MQENTNITLTTNLSVSQLLALLCSAAGIKTRDSSNWKQCAFQPAGLLTHTHTRYYYTHHEELIQF